MNDPIRYHISLLGPRSDSSASWRKVIVEFLVGSPECPDWDSMDVCLNAIEDLVKMSEGVLSDAVVNSLKSHVRVISYDEFGG